MKTTARKKALCSVRATTTLPTNYCHQATLDLSKSKRAVVAAIVSGIMLLIAVGWLFVQFANLVRPSALEALRFHKLLTTTPNGHTSITIPLVDIVIASVLVTVLSPI